MNEHFKIFAFIQNRRFFLYIIVFILSFINKGFSQSISLSFSEINAHEIIEKLESELSIDFNYDYGIFDQTLIQDFSASGSTEEILSTCFTLLNKDFALLEDGLYVIKQSDMPIQKQVDPIKYKISLIDDIKTELAYGIATLAGLTVHFTSDINGDFLIEGYYSPDQKIEFSYLGYKKKIVAIKTLKKDKTNYIVLNEEEHMLDEIIIRDKFLIFEHADLNGHIISEEDAGVGGTMDNDVLRRSQTIAGVYNVTESLNDLQIRGSLAGQTQLQWNNIELYQSNLFLGNVSSINPFMADVIKVNKNGGSADDQGNSSGSIHMQSDHFSSSKSEFKVYSDLLYANVGASTSFLNNKVRVKGAYRNSITTFYESAYYDQLYQNIFQFGPIASDRFWEERYKADNPDDLSIQETQTFDRKVNFGDYSFSVMAKPTSRLTIDANYVNIHSSFTYEQVGEYDGLDIYENSVINKGLSAKVKYQFTPYWKSNIVYSESSFNREYSFFTNKERPLEEDYNIQDNGINQSNIQLNHIFNYKNHEWKIGVGHQRWEVSLIDSSQYGTGFDISEQFRKIATEKSIFLDYTLTIADLIKFRNGTRWADYSLTFDNRVFIEPRIHVSLLPTKHLTIHAHYGTYHRNLNRQFRGSTLQVEGDFWYISDEEIYDPDDWLWTVEEAQYSLGLRYAKGPFSVEIDGYKKTINNIWSATFEFENETNPWRFLDSKVKGLELSLFYHNDWVTLSNTYEFMDDILEVENENTSFKNPYFQPFKTSMNAEFRHKNFKFSAQWNFAKGRFFSAPTKIEEVIKDDGNRDYIFTYAETLNTQISDYHRLDISCFYKLDALKAVDATLGLSIQNVYNRKNITSAFYDIDWNSDPYEPARFDQEGLPFLPNVSLLLEF